MRFKVKKLSDKAQLPLRCESGSAGFDLFSVEDCTILPGERKLISTGLSMKIGAGFYGHISDRSGLAWKKGLHALGKIIDESFLGEIKIILLNTDKDLPVEIKCGDRCAQIIFHKYYTPDFELVNELEQTERGENGFGSSGA